MTNRTPVLLAFLTAMLWAGGAVGQQNVLVNAGFELNPPPSFGNNSPYSTAPWSFVSDYYANVVKVDGPGGNEYGSDGPQSDASAPGAGIAQHYLDTVGPLRFHQMFTPQCSGRVEFGGSFSTRGNLPGSADITIRHGNGLNGTIVAQASTGNLPGGSSRTDPWKTITSIAVVTAGQTYSFVVDLHDHLTSTTHSWHARRSTRAARHGRCRCSNRSWSTRARGVLRRRICSSTSPTWRSLHRCRRTSNTCTA